MLIKVKNAQGWTLTVNKQLDTYSSSLENPLNITVVGDFSVLITPFVKEKLKLDLTALSQSGVLYHAVFPLAQKPSDYQLTLNGYNFLVSNHCGSTKVVFAQMGLLGGVHYGACAISGTVLAAGVITSALGAANPGISLIGSTITGAAIESGLYAKKAGNEEPFSCREYIKSLGKGIAAGTASGAVSCLIPGGTIAGLFNKGYWGTLTEQVIMGAASNGAAAASKEVISGVTGNGLSLTKIGVSCLSGAVSAPIAGLVGAAAPEMEQGLASIVVGTAMKTAEGATKGASKQVVQNLCEGESFSKGVVQAAAISGVVSGAVKGLKETIAYNAEPTPCTLEAETKDTDAVRELPVRETAEEKSFIKIKGFHGKVHGKSIRLSTAKSTAGSANSKSTLYKFGNPMAKSFESVSPPSTVQLAVSVDTDVFDCTVDSDIETGLVQVSASPIVRSETKAIDARVSGVKQLVRLTREEDNSMPWRETKGRWKRQTLALRH